MTVVSRELSIKRRRGKGLFLGIKDEDHSSVLATIMNPSVDDCLKREEKIEKILNGAAALIALVRKRSLEKFAAQF